jgi:hypothetical protein
MISTVFRENLLSDDFLIRYPISIEKSFHVGFRSSFGVLPGP